uniref:GIY-YIG domain-containing protein n=1 Tax=viral metagenome TaxID=1070528 RepID=A0A6C0ADF2_9ZZZZ
MSNFQGAISGKQRYLYVLELKDGFYYVGSTNNLERRYKQHLEGKSSAQWTKLHPPIKMIHTQEMFEDHEENNLTVYYMKKIKGGINKVRGGNYCKEKLKYRIFCGLKKRLKYITTDMSLKEINDIFCEFKMAKYDTKIETIESKLLKKLYIEEEDVKDEDIKNFDLNLIRDEEKKKEKKKSRIVKN